MTALSKLEKVIVDLEKQKNKIIKEIQKSGWEDDRENKPILGGWNQPSFEDLMEYEPEKRAISPKVNEEYQKWYSSTRVIIMKNQPDRILEFEEPYKRTSRGIWVLLQNRYISKADLLKMIDSINVQFDILAAVPHHIKYSIYDIELTAYSVLMDDEIDAARYLLKNGFLRAGGTLAGVSLERHLKILLDKHIPPIKYAEKATLAKLNNACKETVYDIITWRKVQHLIGLRNYCSHDKDREPKKEEVRELIDGVSSIIKMHNPSKP